MPEWAEWVAWGIGILSATGFLAWAREMAKAPGTLREIRDEMRADRKETARRFNQHDQLHAAHLKADQTHDDRHDKHDVRFARHEERIDGHEAIIHQHGQKLTAHEMRLEEIERAKLRIFDPNEEGK
jgi:hypothetical protein